MEEISFEKPAKLDVLLIEDPDEGLTEEEKQKIVRASSPFSPALG